MASSTQLNDLFDEDNDAVHFASTAPARRSPVFDDVEFDEPLDSYDVVRPASRPVLRDDDLPPEIDTDLRIPANALNDSTAAFSSHHRSSGEGLGLDEEVVIKPRKERVKLNEERLLGPMGLPKLRKDAPMKLKFKGKGHEFRDLSNLLNFYQLWAHGVYPKASFRDFLTMTEKLGHSKRMRVARAEWIETERRKDTAQLQEEDKPEELNPFAPGTKADTQPPFDAADGFPSDDEGLEPMEVNMPAESALVKLETSHLQDDDEDALAAMAEFDSEVPW